LRRREEVKAMALIRVVSRVDKKGRITLPINLRRAAGLRAGRVVEMKIAGSRRKPDIRLTPQSAVGRRLAKPPKKGN
jgi:bifunctional DNA-binding transcriptional regulator/antitoxin component of YhaV-PrlF toxin-antitoxin module